MSVETVNQAVAEPAHQRASRFPNAKVSQWRVIKAEWIKFLSLRSTVWTLLGSCIVVIGFGMLAAGVMIGDITPRNGGAGGANDPLSQITIDPTYLSMAGTQLAVLILGSLGVLMISGEYSSGMIRTTMAAVPRRLPVLWAKTLVLTVVSTVLMAASVFIAFFATQSILKGNVPTANLSDPHVLRALLGNVAYLVGIAIIGLALGALLRSSAGGLATLFGGLFIFPNLISLIMPSSWSDAIAPYLPSNAGQAFTLVDPTAQSAFAPGGGVELLSPGIGALVFAAWVVGLLIAAAVGLRRRDV